VGQEALSVMSVLHQKMHRVPPCCRVCRKEDEIMQHMVFACDHARAEWFSSSQHVRTNERALNPKMALMALYISLAEQEQKVAA
jgi:zinc-binding in reverse transcriptase